RREDQRRSAGRAGFRSSRPRLAEPRLPTGIVSIGCRPPPSQSAMGDEIEAMGAIEIEHGGGRLLDRTASDVDCRPTALRKKPARRRDFFRYRNTVDVF